MLGSDTAPTAIPLSAEDRAILSLESPTVAGHICFVTVTGPGLDASDVRQRVQQRLGSVPSLRRRLGTDAGQPAWVPDDSFDIGAHIVAERSDSPLAPPDVTRRIATLFTQRLDRARPLWRLDLLGPTDDGSLVIVWRIHHSLADGMTAVRYARAILWDPVDQPPRSPGDRDASTNGTSNALHAAEAEDAHHRHRGRLIGFLDREFTPSLVRSPFDGKIGPERDVAFAVADLPQLHDAARSLADATLNDAILSCVAGGIRRWLEKRHGAVGELRVKVPVSLHAGPDDDSANRDSYFCLSLPIGETDPVERLQLVRTETLLRKQDHDAEEMDRFVEALSGLSPRLRLFGERLQNSPREFALNVSNVPGPPDPVTILGNPVSAFHTLADIRQRHALRIAITSMADRLSFGLCADPNLIEGVSDLANLTAQEASSLVSAVR